MVEERELSQREVEAMPELLKVRELLQQGSPSLALEKLVEIVGKTQGGEAVSSIMERGRQEYKRLQEQEEALQRAEEEDVRSVEVIFDFLQGDEVSVAANSILEEAGREHLVIRAWQTGTDAQCKLCKGMVSVKRLEQHYQYWCPELHK